MSIFRPGDQILFRQGDQFADSLVITTSGTLGSPIRFAAFGSAEKAPVINGFQQLTNWQAVGNGVWKTAYNSPTGSVRNLFVDGKFQPIGRYPNTDAPNGGYLTITQKNGKTITVDGLKGNWAGGDAVIRTARWILEREQIEQQNGTQITLSKNTQYKIEATVGFFIANHPNTLDREGEWAYDADAKEIYLFSSAKPDTKTIYTAHERRPVRVNRGKHIVIDGFSVQGPANTGIIVYRSSFVTVANCTVFGSGQNGITAYESEEITLSSNIIDYANNNGITINSDNKGWPAWSIKITGNKITRTALIAGMGENGDNKYFGISAQASELDIRDNRVDQTGYVGIGFVGQNVHVENNYVTDFCLVKDDGGGIYGWVEFKVPGQDITIKNNVVSGAGSSSVGFGTKTPENIDAFCYYLDGRTSDVDLQYNTAHGKPGNGIYLHNTNDSRISNNQIFDSSIGMLLSYDNTETGSPLRNNTITHNVVFAKDASQEIIRFASRDNNFDSAGVIDNNYYYHPSQPDPKINVTRFRGGSRVGEWYSLERWQTAFGHDIHSQTTPDERSLLMVDRYLSDNLIPNGTFESDSLNGWRYYTTNAGGIGPGEEVLDKGSLILSYRNTTGSNPRLMVHNNPGIGAFEKDGQYLLTFSVIGGDTAATLETRIQRNGPYTQITDSHYSFPTASRQDITQLLNVNESVSDGRVSFNLLPTQQAVHLDNISLRKVLMKPFVAFRVNPSAKQASFSLPEGNWLALGGSTYQATITLPPFRSAILIPVVEPTTDIWLEAECGTLAPSASFWSQVNQSNASGRVLMQADTAFSGGQQTGREDPRRQLSFSFSLAKAGNYHLFARHTMPSGSGSSFIFRVDNERWWTWETMQTGSLAWQEMVASPFALTAGKHTLTVVNHRQGSQLDKLLLSLDSSLPTGEGSTAGNCSTNARIEDGFKSSLLTDAESEDSALVVYPNPADHSLTIYLPGNTQPGTTLLLTDLSGKVIRRIIQPATGGAHSATIDAEAIPAGMYLLQWQAERLYKVKVLIEH